jgi:peptide/nickel transport system substrate-binding protein
MPKKIIWSLLVCILAVVLVASSCQSKTTTEMTTTETKEPVYGGEINLASYMDVDHWNPYYTSGAADTPKSFFYEKLMIGDWGKSDQYPFTGTTVPLEYSKGNLAESWEIPDPLTYTFRLRHGIKFQNKPPVNGRELTAADVKYSFDMILGTGSGFTSKDPNFSFPAYSSIQSITTPDDYTVVFHLSTASPLMLDYLGPLCNIFIIPSEVMTAGPDDWKNATGSGPYTVSEYTPASSITFKSNPEYWGFDEKHPNNRLPYTSTVNYLILPDLSTAISALRTGKIDILGNIGWETAAEIKKTDPQLKYRDVTLGSVGLAVRNDLKPYSDVRVRQALQMALNLPEINQTYYGGTADPFPSMVNSSSYLYVPFSQYPKETQDIYTYNIDKAKQLLTDAGYSTGFTVKMICTQAGAWPYASADDAELVKSYWAKIGVTLNIEVLEQATAGARYATGNYEICSWATAIDWSPLDMFACWQKGVPWNFARVNDPIIEQYIKDFTSNPDPAQRTKIGKEFVMYATQQVNYVALPVQTNTFFWQPWLIGYKGQFGLGVYQEGGLYARLWVDQVAKKAGQQ